MKNLQVQIQVDDELFVRNPDSTELGRRIVSESIILINELGYEEFTFKKLGKSIGSPESSIYRYFESKQALLIYLVSWYWSWVDYKLVFATTNIDSPKIRLEKAISVLTSPVEEDHAISYINELLLSEIINAESVKAYHTKDVDIQNKKGNFKKYKQVVQRVSDIILEINPGFEYSHMLISTVIEGVHNQRFFAEHLPALTDVQKGEDIVPIFYNKMVFSVIE